MSDNDIEMTEPMSKEEMIDILKGLVFGTFDRTTAKEREALDIAIKELEKDIPKAPKKSDTPRCGMGYEYYDWYCPTCNTFLASECDTKRQYIRHCECGQRLDWRKA